ncbi:P-loop containing nucleoside triphosphate hydrolase protein [Ganoderma leucocontextum]|nr:P-loop containing nucleoside triphosphate hydrolase protein [Ganoderma leucocontextum]
MPTFTQNVVPGLPAAVPVKRFKADSCLALVDNLGLSSQSSTGDPVPLAVSFRLTKRGLIEAFALATPTSVFQVTVSSHESHRALASVLRHPNCLFVAFDMARAALLIHRQFAVHTRGVDLTTLPCKTSSAGKMQHPAVRLAQELLPNPVYGQGICALFYRNSNKDLCLRAWLSACIASRSIPAIEQALKVDTRNLSGPQLACLSQLVLNVELLDVERPSRMENDFEQIGVNAQGNVTLRNARFKTKVRESGQTVVYIDGGKVKALATGAKGKETTLKLLKGKLPDKVKKVCVVGREEPTSAEGARDGFVLSVLQGVQSMDDSRFVRMLWFPQSKPKAGHLKKTKANAGVEQDLQITTPSFQNLNASQQAVVRAMAGKLESLVKVRGPPGTGKTSTIAAALEYWEKHREPAWVIAHSNVGVKNIAESLVKRNIDFKIIVSQDFYYEWHEHHYVDITSHLIQSDKLSHGLRDIKDLIKSKIILCTLSMLSTPTMASYGVFKLVPVERLIVDEASQIDTFEFMHVFHKFTKSLSKVCMFGDPNQLPPFGKETAPKMKTIFDFAQFHESSYFLDTQYRMPVPLGEFISKHVYGSKLKSEHAITAHTCVKFVDVRKGTEAAAGSSWKNMEEVHTIVNLVKKYYKDDKKVCIITPYDGQRAAIVAALKAANLPSSNVYNVDSYQGHEAPFVIVSVVRTSAPGFLKSLNRMNVMLTRCQAGMVLVTSRAFLCGPAHKTLLGRLAEHWGVLSGADVTWVDAMRVADGKARLPGAGQG